MKQENPRFEVAGGRVPWLLGCVCVLLVFCFSLERVWAGELIVFNGVVELGSEVRVSVAGPDRSLGSRWVSLGQEVFGGRVVDYLPADRAILFQKGGFSHQIALSDAFETRLTEIVQSGEIPEAVPASRTLIPFASLPEDQQKLFNDVRFVDMLHNSGIEVPQELQIRYKSERIRTSIQKSSATGSSDPISAGPSGTRKPRGASLPLFGNSTTSDEKADRAEHYSGQRY